MRLCRFAPFLAFVVTSSLVACTGDDPVLCSGASCPSDPAADGGASSAPGIAITDASAALTLVQGSSSPVAITITRTDFDGAVSVALSGLPAGVAAAPLVIAAGATTGTLSLSSLPDVPQGTTAITLTASDVVDGMTHSERSGSLLVRGAAGGIDTTFGTIGTVTTQIGVSGFAVHGLVVQPDGLALIAGQDENDVVVARLDTKGALDATYGAQGKVTADLAFDGTSAYDVAQGIALAPNGGSFIAGWTTNPYSKYAVARFSEQGALDPTFATSGYIVSDFLPQPTWNGDVLAWGVTVQQDGKPVFAGEVLESGGYHHPVIARFKTNGAPDDTFGGGQVGWFSRQVFVGATPTDSSDDTCAAVALGPNGTIVGGGTSTQGSAELFFAVRLDAAGLLDPTFGNGGFAQTLLPSPAVATSVSVLADGRVLVTGTTASQIVVVRFDAAGQLDTSYAGTGKAIIDVGAPVVEGSARGVLDSAGRLVVSAATGTNNDMAVARVLDSGALDTTFGTQGHVVTPVLIKSVSDNVRAAIAPDGRIVIATSTDSSTPSLVAARLWY